ncbi:transglutaminase superfamily protein [Homoserinimonas aerilata]|uniref:Transglutaminase superfamily protein n=1 Tax=Homoserinimonas aerilata TaxID=1162970 RepID=A0A542YK87_9MICO|nr:transglutaminase domain-containing protein [Homoserinimonas aerilata]TQL48485.1 transglutaminase superfamily protein [Homoserinimonas aerilata]
MRRPRRQRAAFVVVATATFWVGLAIAVTAFWPIYEHPQFIIMAVGTIVLGSAIALLGAVFRWPSPVVLLLTLIVFAVFGVPFAVPELALYGVLPTLDGLLELVTGAALGWKQLLTITLPVGTYQGLLVPAFLLILVATVGGLSTALRARFGELSALFPSAVLLVGLLFGPKELPFAMPLVLGFLVAVLGTLAWWRWQRRRDAIRALAATTPGTGAAPLETAERSGGIRAVASAVVILAIAVGTGSAAVSLAPPSRERVVLRDTVERPFDPQEYASPLSAFRRYLQPGTADAAMLTASGLPEGGRLRIATLDTYNGVVFSVGSEQTSSESGSFTRVPTSIDQSAIDGEHVTLDIVITGYKGIWVPTAGKLQTIDFVGADASGLKNSFFYNDVSGTAVALDGLGEGSGYELDAVVTPMVADSQLASLAPGTATVPVASAVPDDLAVTLDGWVRDATTPGERLRAMLAGIATEGYISHGGADEPPSRSGHGADRIAQLLTDPIMIGDQEQYAVTAALMARAIGFPSRVVVGFVPDSVSSAGDATVVRGSDASAWIEVNTLRQGWVAVDPTPPVREIPLAEPEEPAQVARPQTPVPPRATEPDGNTDQIPLDSSQEEDPVEDPFLAILLAALVGLGVTLLVIAVLLSPFIAIVAAKLRRRHLRQRASSPAQRISGGWREFEDAIIDYGYTPPASPTRSEVAETVGGIQPLVLASVADRATFAPEQVREEEAIQVWTAVRELGAGLGEGRTRWQRLKALVSLRSLGGYSVKELFARERRLP